MSRSPEDRLLSVIRQAFRDYAIAHDLTTDQFDQVKLGEFVEWVKPRLPNWREAYREGLDVLNEDLDYAIQIFSDPYLAGETIIPLWFLLTHSGDEPIKHVPDLLWVQIRLVWDSQTAQPRALTMDNPIPWQGKMTQGFLASFLLGVMKANIEEILKHGVDNLYEKQAVDVPMEKPNVPTEPTAAPISGDGL